MIKKSSDTAKKKILGIVYALLIPMAFLMGTSTHAQTEYTVQTIPNPRVTYGGFVSDPDDVINASEEATLNQMLVDLEKETTAEYAVVIVNSIGEQIPKDFAVELFNTWGIGKAGKDNGLLLVVVLNQRRWEFETGYGLEGVLPDVKLSHIADDTLPPNFKKGEYGQGVIEASKEIAEVLRENKEEVSMSPEEYRAKHSRMVYSVIAAFASVFTILYLALVILIRRNKSKNSPKESKWDEKAKDASLSKMPGWIYWPLALFWIPIIVWVTYWYFDTGDFIARFGRLLDEVLGWFIGFIAYLWVSVTVLINKLRKNWFISSLSENPYETYQKLSGLNSNLWVGAILSPVFFLPYYLYNHFKLRSLRDQPRNCPQCSSKLHKLDEKSDDEFLVKGKQVEEQIGSVDHDVWVCNNDNYALVLGYKKWSRYQECPSCKFRTYAAGRSWTVTAATYESSGSGITEYICKNCGIKKEVSFTIAKLVRSSSSSSGGSYSSGSSGGGSSSGGSSFGGGSSGGGGSGGSW